MRSHESHGEGGFGVPNNVITRHAVSYDTRPTTGLLPSSAPLPALLNRSDCRATISRIQPPGMPPLCVSLSLCTRTSYSTTIAPISRQQHNKHSCQTQAAALLPRGCNPAVSDHRLPGQLQRETRPPATQPPPRGIQTECQVSPPESSSSQDRQFTRPRPILSQRLLTQ